jgi:hypothetical protein
MTNKEFINYIRGFEVDHTPEGWPAIKMGEVSRLLDMVDRYREALEITVSALQDISVGELVNRHYKTVAKRALIFTQKAIRREQE